MDRQAQLLNSRRGRQDIFDIYYLIYINSSSQQWTGKLSSWALRWRGDGGGAGQDWTRGLHTKLVCRWIIIIIWSIHQFVNLEHICKLADYKNIFMWWWKCAIFCILRYFAVKQLEEGDAEQCSQPPPSLLSAQPGRGDHFDNYVSL